MGYDPREVELWEGPEVEGHLQGIWTLFVGDIGTIASLDKVSDLSKYKHIYFNQGAVFSPDGVFDEAAKRRILDMWKAGWYFTISLTNPELVCSIPDILSDCCHIVAVIDGKWMNQLSAFDEVKIQGEDGWCWMISKASMLPTHPFAYRRDKLVDFKEEAPNK